MEKTIEIIKRLIIFLDIFTPFFLPNLYKKYAETPQEATFIVISFQ